MCGTKKVNRVVAVITVRKKKPCKYLGKSIVTIRKHKRCNL